MPIVYMVDDKTEKYCLEHTTPMGELWQRLDRETHAKILQPRMLSGSYQGRLLAMLSQFIQPTRILEIGTYTGYSALCLAEGLKPEGKLLTIDINEELETFTRSFFESSPHRDKIDYRIGNAREIIPTLPEDWKFDLVFIDADKLAYPIYYELVIDKMNPGGVIISDNVLWDQKVPDEQFQDKKTNGLRTYNQTLHQDPRTENILLPIRDGLLITRVKTL